MKNRAEMRDWYWIFDGNHSVDENELLRSEGFKVGLGGELSYKMEKDREFGIELAEKYGGSISAQTRDLPPGAATRFRVELPLAQ